jgi:alcohol dehydrogenase
MKALVYHCPGVKVWEDVGGPELQAIVEVGTTTMCGTDLHNLNGDLPTMVDGRIIGHEAVGTVSQVGSGVENPKVGDRVLVSFVSANGACRFCRESRYGQCTGGGRWAPANLIDGTQAEQVRVPFAGTSTYPSGATSGAAAPAATGHAGTATGLAVASA